MNENNSILFLGDVVPYKHFKFKNNSPTVANLECPITDEGVPITGKINLGVKENYLKKIFGTNLLSVSLGNNHILDYGLAGLNSTIKELETSGISYFGVNMPDNDKNNPLIMKFNNEKIAFLSVICDSTSPLVEFDDFNYLSLLNEDEISEKIKKIRNKVKRIVIYVHWGMEESSYPTLRDIGRARRMVDSGADIVIGSHAHAPQPVEQYHNGIIAYNLGNFIMPAFEKMPSYYDENGIAQSDFSKKLMPWNRISWGLYIDMGTLEFRIRKYGFIADRILELAVTPYDKYLKLNNDMSGDSYERLMVKHLRRRELRRRLRDFIRHPHIPKIISGKS